MRKDGYLRILALVLTSLMLGACATTQGPESCPAGTQKLPDCPPLGAVDDPFINELYERRSWIAPKDLPGDPIEMGKQADIPVQPALTKFLGPTDEAALNSLAAKLWMIENAEHTIDFTYYIFKTDLIGNALLGAMCNAVKRGVDVRVTVDAMGSFNGEHPELKALATCADEAGFMRNKNGEITTRKARVQVVVFNALSKPNNPNRRSHDKLLVKDGSFETKSYVMTGGRNISKDYYGINEDGTRDKDPFRDAEILIRTAPMTTVDTYTVGEVSEVYSTILFLIPKNRRVLPAQSERPRQQYKIDRQKAQESLWKLKGFENFAPQLAAMDTYMTSGFEESLVRLAHELGNLTDRKVTKKALENQARNPNSIMDILDQVSEQRPDARSVRIVSPYLFLAEYEDGKGNVVRDEAVEFRQWLDDHPEATLEIITNSVLTSDNFPAQSVIDMETAPRLLMEPEMREQWLAVAGPDEMDSDLVNSQAWQDAVGRNRLRIYETGRLDSVLLGQGDKSYGKLHAKFIIEGDFGFIGTANFDYRSRLYNNEMGFFFLDEGLAAEVHAGFDQLKSISYRWGSPEWFEMRKAVMGLKGMKGSSTRKQSGFYRTFKKTGFIWWL